MEKNINLLIIIESIKFIDFKYDFYLLLVGLGKFKFIIYVYFLKCLFECFSIYI